MTEETFNCFFKKSELNNLLILCNIKEMIDFSLGKIEQKIILNDIHIKYNFIILPVENSEIVSIDDIGSKALFLYPKRKCAASGSVAAQKKQSSMQQQCCCPKRK